MSAESILKMFLCFAGLTGLLVYVVIQGIPKPPKHKASGQKLIHETVRRYLIRKVCQEFDLLESQLDKRALNRIDGVAFKSVKPLMKDQEVYIQLPSLIQKLGDAKDFELVLTFDEIKTQLKNK